MGVEQFRGYVAAITAMLCVVGGGAALVIIWMQPITEPPRELALIFGVLGGIIGSGTTFLFVAEGSSRAAHAAERAMNTGVVAGASMPGTLATPAAGEVGEVTPLTGGFGQT